MQKWFLLGLGLGIAGVLLPRLLLSFGIVLADSPFAIIYLSALLVVLMLACFEAAIFYLKREHRPHTLFTPLYDQR